MLKGSSGTFDDAAASTDSKELGSVPSGLSLRVGWIELVLLIVGRSVFAGRFREKNAVFDAVIGVVGVFGIIFDGGGLRFRSAWSCFCERAAIFAAVGVLKGPTVIGGSCNGWRFLRDWADAVAPDLVLASPSYCCGWNDDFRVLVFRLIPLLWSGGGGGGIEMVSVVLPDLTLVDS